MLERGFVFFGSAELLLSPVNFLPFDVNARSISGLVVECIVAIDVTRVRFSADAFMWASSFFLFERARGYHSCLKWSM